MKSMKRFCLILCILVLVSSASIKLSMAKPWSGPTIYIKSDGSIEPSDAPIVTSDKVTYRVTDDIQINITSSWEAIVVERNNIILDGQNHIISAPEKGGKVVRALRLENRSNITIKNIKVEKFNVGISLLYSNNITITGNIAENNSRGIYLGYSNNNTIAGNIAENNAIGIRPRFSNGNNIHRNDFIGNQIQVSSMESANFWDDGSKGNYWSDYLGSDADGDGVGDTPYVIDDNNKDNRPSMQAYFKAFFEVSDLNINPSSVRLGETVTISITVKNTGGKTGLHSVTLKVDNHIVDTKSITLESGQSATVGFTYTPTSEGTYSIDVNGLTGSLTVSKEEVQAPAEIPWLIIIGVLVVLVAAVLVLLLWRRKRVPPPPPPPP